MQPEVAAAIAAIQQALSPGFRDPLWHAVDRLSALHSVSVFEATVAELSDPDVDDALGLWMQALIVRGHDLSSSPAARQVQQRLIAAAHPLAQLPLRLLGIEAELIDDHRRDVRGVPGPGAAIAAVVAATPAAMNVAVERWGGTCAAVFELASPAPAISRELLYGLPGTAVLAGSDPAQMTLHEIGPSRAAGELHLAARNGGSNIGGVGPAHGRRAMWTTVAAMVGAAPRARCEAIDELARRCSWAHFTIDPSIFFYNEAIDFGFVALRPDGRSIAIVAATDTD